MKMKIFDSHAHYDDDSFNEDRIRVLEELKNNNIIGVLNCGSSFKGAVDSLNLAKNNDFFYAAVGIHPEYADTVDEDMLNEIKNMTSHPKVKAIGEIGLDYYYEDNPPKEVQKEAFIKQMKLAKELNLPVVIHDRDAHKDILDIIKMFPEVHGVIHCFSGSVELSRECLKLGYYIGFTGIVTFKNARKTLEVVKEVPIDKILVETDCPYMAPEPHRGKRNRSEYIEQIIKKVAKIKEISEEELNNQVILNTKHLLNIK
ncbi:TatD family hydrolase [Clostridium tetani]|uniref:Hydrolase TatD n=1 Tax=Clostridium tetani TaxID=1513 RepID=A0ABY0ESD8_CLOTA|nr:TatD family hydrolase [Clostridium tetani]RXI58477.1 hydrolase TatD [Clostridium tetani]RXI73189.1 hydrolase TatD [Clostridium tetani]